MNLFALFGNPVSHSKSPRMHNCAFRHLGLKDIYTRYKLEDPSKLKEIFLKLQLSGANITVPHKEVAYLQCDEVCKIAKDIKAVNTIIRKNDKLIGYNTDADGFYMSIKDMLPLKNALIIGAGGSAKAISCILKNNNIEVSILNRSKEKLKNFTDFQTNTWTNFKPKKYELLINTTSAGLNDDELPAPKDIILSLIKSAKFAFDAIYHKQTPFIKLCKQHNLTCKNGEDMLLYQGVLAFELFTDSKINADTINAMKIGLQLK